jgi:hypothetical protein
MLWPLSYSLTLTRPSATLSPSDGERAGVGICRHYGYSIFENAIGFASSNHAITHEF